MHIKNFIKARIDPDFRIEDDLPFPTELKLIKKHMIITPYQRIEKYAYFLVSGIVKISIMRHEEEERILEFFSPHSFFSCYTSFLTQAPSDVQIESLTDIEVEVIRYEDIKQAYNTSLLANKLGRIVAEYYYIRKTIREKNFLTKSATERYEDLVRDRPELILQIPVNQIAKYLGIESESLSRIRKSKE